MNVLKILLSLEILPQRDLMTMPILVGHTSIASLNQAGSAQGPVPERMDKLYQVYQFIPGIAIFYHLARCNKFIPDLFPE